MVRRCPGFEDGVARIENEEAVCLRVDVVPPEDVDLYRFRGIRRFEIDSAVDARHPKTGGGDHNLLARQLAEQRAANGRVTLVNETFDSKSRGGGAAVASRETARK